MENDVDDLDNLFDEYDSNDPQPQENANNENAENEAPTPEKVPVPKRVIKHPRLKFNPERLCGKRGIPILVDHFKDVKFKGKGNEKEDLKKLLTSLELWTHRLFPSMKFEDCLRQIEHLGKKRPVKTCLQKIRLDFPILDRDFVNNEEEEVQDEPNEVEPEPPVQDAFDRLFDDYQERAQPVVTSTPNSSQTVGNILGTSFGASISEEQKKRMEYNKMLAIERRKCKVSAIQSSSLNDSADIESTTSVKTFPNSSYVKRSDTIDPNFLFDCLQEQFAYTGGFNVNDKVEKKCSQFEHAKDESDRDKIMESVDGNRDETDLDVLTNVKNNDCAKGNDKQELELDELMDLVDGDDENETVHIALTGVRNNDCSEINGKEELGSDELTTLIMEDNLNATDGLGNGDKDGTHHDTLSGVKNNDCPESDGKAELGLDQLMDLVEDDDQEAIDNS